MADIGTQKGLFRKQGLAFSKNEGKPLINKVLL